MNYDVIIIGAGPGGYVAAIRAAQTGLKTLVLDKEFVGGMCLNWGCIPTKTFLETAKLYKRLQKAEEFGIAGISSGKMKINWPDLVKRAGKISGRLTKGIEFLFNKHGVEYQKGEAVILDKNRVRVGKKTYSGNHIIIATGSSIPQADLPVPSEKILEIRSLLSLKSIPENIVVYGNNPHSIELAQFFAMIGKQTTLLVKDDLNLPGLDPFIVNFIKNRLKKDGVSVLSLNDSVKFSENEIVSGSKKIPFEIILNAQSRIGNIPFSELALPIKNGFLEVDRNLRAGYPNIYSIGDVNGKSYLAHAASAQGIWVIDHINGVKEELQLNNYPFNIYTEPEIAQIGLTEPEVKSKKIEYKISEFPLSANAKSLIESSKEGIIRIISDLKYGEILGVQIIASNATDLISEAGALIEMEATIFDAVKIVHAHPTVSEIFGEVTLEAIDKAIHL